MKVVKVTEYGLEFDSGHKLYANHDTNCCEWHYLDFSHSTMEDFLGLDFDLSSDRFFQRIEDYGIALLPKQGHPVRIPGYGTNNGYYSSNLDLVLTSPDGTKTTYDIEECQNIKWE